MITIYLFWTRLVIKREETNRVTNNIEIPPTTPDNLKNTLTTSAANTVSPKSNIALNNEKVLTSPDIKNEKAAAKHSSNLSNVS